MVSTKSSTRWPRFILGALLLTAFWVVQWARAGGVTIITHGFSGDVNGWISGMAGRIPAYARFPGTNFTTYTITLTTDGTNYFYQWQRTNAAPAVSDSGEIIVKLDWSQMAGGTAPYDISTYDVAQVASHVLMQTNAIADLGGHALAELPLHLIGHSRGGSLVSEMTRILGTNGVWVDHLTTLDPHPLNNDGFFDPLPVTDAPVHTYVNVLFHDNYWENINFYPYGEPIAGAYVRRLTNLSGGYSSAHSDVHLWYYGTLDWRTPASDTEASITSVERQNWWNGYEQKGTNAGFCYSLVGGGNRLSTDQPLGSGAPAIRDGYNQWWDLGAGGATNRTPLATNIGAWPNLIKLDRTDTNQVVQGQNVSLKLFYQWGQPGASNATIAFYLDADLNPFNSNGKLLGQVVVPASGTAGVNSGTFAVPLYATNAAPGWHSLFAVISGGSRTRVLYASQWVQVVADQSLPDLEIARLPANQLVIGVHGAAGQTIVLQTSSDLVNWTSVATNTLLSDQWRYTNTLSVGASSQFFRGIVGN